MSFSDGLYFIKRSIFYTFYILKVNKLI